MSCANCPGHIHHCTRCIEMSRLCLKLQFDASRGSPSPHPSSSAPSIGGGSDGQQVPVLHFGGRYGRGQRSELTPESPRSASCGLALRTNPTAAPATWGHAMLVPGISIASPPTCAARNHRPLALRHRQPVRIQEPCAAGKVGELFCQSA